MHHRLHISLLLAICAFAAGSLSPPAPASAQETLGEPVAEPEPGQEASSASAPKEGEDAPVETVEAAASLRSYDYGSRVLKLGAEGTDVMKLQRLLSRLGHEASADGKFGRGTEAAVKLWERSRDKVVDGAVERDEASRIKRAARRRRAEEKEGPPRFGERKLETGMHGRDVRKLQRLLDKMAIETTADGAFGAGTAKSVRRYERWRKLRADGVVPGPEARRIERDAARGAKRPRKRRSGGGKGDGHAFPVRGPYNFGGDGSRFGAPRSGRSHQGQDIAAATGQKIVSIHRGRVAVRAYQANGAGNYVVIYGDDGRDSVYMHMAEPASVDVGEKVRAGERIGSVGNTGASFGAHLHFELWTPHWYDGGKPYDPLPLLRRWAD